MQGQKKKGSCRKILLPLLWDKPTIQSPSHLQRVRGSPQDQRSSLGRDSGTPEELLKPHFFVMLGNGKIR